MKLSSTAFACFTVLALTVCQFHTIVAIHGGAWNDTHEIRQIADGNPEWAVLANRMLVPKTVKAVSLATGQAFDDVWHSSVFTMMLVGNLACYFLLSRRPDTRRFAAAFAMAQGAAYVCLQDVRVVLPCDPLDYTVWFLFAYCAFTRAPWWSFLCLFAVELHNRECAVFIAAWGILTWLVPPRRSFKALACGLFWVGCAAAGMKYIEFLRRVCLTQPLPAHGERQVWGQIWTLQSNLTALQHLWPSRPYMSSAPWHTRLEETVAVSSLALLAAGMVRLATTKLDWWQWVRLALFFGAYLTLEAMFGVSDELRTWACLIPFVLFTFFYAGHETNHS